MDYMLRELQSAARQDVGYAEHWWHAMNTCTYYEVVHFDNIEEAYYYRQMHRDFVAMLVDTAKLYFFEENGRLKRRSYRERVLQNKTDRLYAYLRQLKRIKSGRDVMTDKERGLGMERWTVSCLFDKMQKNPMKFVERLKRI